MFYFGSNGQVKKAVMLFTLLMFSTLLQAESPENAGSNGSATKIEAGLESAAAADEAREFNFPSWPERQQTNRQRIPPPPPGPYMSSALSDFTVSGPSFGRTSGIHELNKPVFELDSSSIPMETFSPDRPWPELSHTRHKHRHNSDCSPSCSPSRWMPENGYQFVQPRVTKKPYPVVQNRMTDRRALDRRMNGPGSRLPSTGGTPNRQYPSPPHYAPRNTGPVN